MMRAYVCVMWVIGIASLYAIVKAYTCEYRSVRVYYRLACFVVSIPSPQEIYRRKKNGAVDESMLTNQKRIVFVNMYVCL